MKRRRKKYSNTPVDEQTGRRPPPPPMCHKCGADLCGIGRCVKCGCLTELRNQKHADDFSRGDDD